MQVLLPCIKIVIKRLKYIYKNLQRYFLPTQEPTMLTLENSAQIFNALSDLPGEINDPDELIQVI